MFKYKIEGCIDCSFHGSLYGYVIWIDANNHNNKLKSLGLEFNKEGSFPQSILSDNDKQNCVVYFESPTAIEQLISTVTRINVFKIKHIEIL